MLSLEETKTKQKQKQESQIFFVSQLNSFSVIISLGNQVRDVKSIHLEMTKTQTDPKKYN